MSDTCHIRQSFDPLMIKLMSAALSGHEESAGAVPNQVISKYQCKALVSETKHQLYAGSYAVCNTLNTMLSSMETSGDINVCLLMDRSSTGMINMLKLNIYECSLTRCSRGVMSVTQLLLIIFSFYFSLCNTLKTEAPFLHFKYGSHL